MTHSIISERMGSLITDTVAASAQVSAGVCLQGRPILGLVLPALNDTPDVNVEVSIDGGDTWLDLLQDDGSTQAIEIAGGASAFAVSSDELTPLAAYVDDQVLVRLALSVAQTAARIITWIALG